MLFFGLEVLVAHVFVGLNRARQEHVLLKPQAQQEHELLKPRAQQKHVLLEPQA